MSRVIAGSIGIEIGPEFVDGYGDGAVGTVDNTVVRIFFPEVGVTASFYGRYTFDQTGHLSGGVVDEVVQIFDGQLLSHTYNVGASAIPFFVAVADVDSPTLHGMVFGGPDDITGSSQADLIIALDGNDTVDGAAGDDDVNGNLGQDIVHGGAGADSVRGGKDNDTVYGDGGDDGHVNGNIGDDIVHGGDGADTVYGGQGQDTLFGDAGDDLLSGDLGFDVLMGGAGADRFTIRAGGGFDWVADFNAAEGDRILLAPGAAFTVGSASGQVVIDLGGGTFLGLAGVPSAAFSADWIVVG
jgi:hypothetical protein